MGKNFFTRYHNALSDPESYYDFQKEMNDRAVSEIYSSFKSQTSFRAVVMPLNINNSLAYEREYGIIRVRPLDIEDFILPEPCFSGSTVCDRNMILGMHPLAYPVTTWDTSLPSLAYGDHVEVRYQSGPDAGKLRGLEWVPGTEQNDSGINRIISCFGPPSRQGVNTRRRRSPSGPGSRRTTPEQSRRRQERAYQNLQQQEGQTYDNPDLNPATPEFDEPEGEITRGIQPQYGFHWDVLGELADTGMFQELITAITKHESEMFTHEALGEYEAYNLQKTYQYGSARAFEQYYKKKLTELKIQTVTDVVHKKKVFNSTQGPKAVFATGKYQIIPDTLRLALTETTGIDTNLKFNAVNQDRFGMYLLFMKREHMSKYLRGKGDATGFQANMDMCEEWASCRLKFDSTRTNSHGIKPKAGESFYKGDNVNPTDLKIGQANELFTVQVQTREKVIQDLSSPSSKLKPIFDKWKGNKWKL